MISRLMTGRCDYHPRKVIIMFIDDQLHPLLCRCFIRSLMKLATMLALRIGILFGKGMRYPSYLNGKISNNFSIIPFIR